MSFPFQPPSCSRTNRHYYVFWPSASCFRLPAVQELPHSLHGKRKHQQLSLVWWVRTFLFWCPSYSRAAWLRKHTFTAQREARGLSLGRQVKRPCFSKRLCCKNMLYITLTDCRSPWMERRHMLLTCGRLQLSNPFSPSCCTFRMHQDVGNPPGTVWREAPSTCQSHWPGTDLPAPRTFRFLPAVAFFR